MASLFGQAMVGLLGLVAVYLILDGAGKLRTWNLLRSSPTTGTVSEPGFVQITGTARTLNETVDPPMTGTESVLYEFSDKRREHDDDGGTTWRTVSSDSDSVPFVIESESGAVAVDPDKLDGGDTLLDGYEEQDGDRRRNEVRLDTGEQAYVAGTAVSAAEADIDADGHDFVITDDPDSALPLDFSGLASNPFILSDSKQDDIVKNQLKNGIMLVLVGVGLVGMAAVLVL